MKRLLTLLPALLLCACLEPDLEEELGDLPRGTTVSICIDDGECRIDLLGHGCTPGEVDACAPTLTPGTIACYTPGAICEVWAAGPCPAGSFEACGYFEP